MDPDANLEAMLERARAILAQADADVGDGPMHSEEAVELAELVVALDEWLNKGGALPQAWSEPAFSNGVTIAQAIALGSKVIPTDQMHVTPGGAGLTDEYLLVTYTNDSFVLGIDREGRCSS